MNPVHQLDDHPALPFAVRDWTAADVIAVRVAARRVGPEHLYNRFLTGTSCLPRPYLRHVRDAWPTRWDAVVAVHHDDNRPEGEGEVIGWAEAGRALEGCDSVKPAGPDGLAAGAAVWSTADVAVVVVDDWQRRGVGSALVEALVARCQQRPVQQLSADILASNVAARRLAARYLAADNGHRVLSHTWERAAGDHWGLGAVDCLTVDLASIHAA
jgi:GNAT superfamily N-acetyltransferase